MKKYNIFITKRIPEAGLELIRGECGGFEMNREPRTLSKKELIKKVRGRDGILCLLTDIIDADVIRAAGERLKVISNCAVGFENVDVPESTRRGILVTNTPGVLTLATAEMAWTLLLAAARRVSESDRFTRAGKFKGWDPLLYLGRAVFGKTLGIVGAGRIGSAFGRMSRGFEMRVLYFSRNANEILERELGAHRVSLEALLRESDFVSLHVPLSRETHHLIGRRELGWMKPGAVLVNTARGPVIDEIELVRALRSGRIAGAGLDVYEREPRLAPGLSRCPNAVLAPHLASATTETRDRMARLAAENLIAGLKGERPRYIVNPEILHA